MKKQLILLACILLSNMLFSQAVPTALEAWRTTDGTQNFYYKPVTKTDPSGNVIVAGATNAGSTTDILVAKYNAAGNQLWIQQFQGAATGGIDFAAGLTVDNNYIYITGGVTNNSVTPETDCVTMKLASSTGSVVWSASYDGAGNFHDAGRHIVVDGSGNVYVSGGSYNASMNTDFLCLKYNSSGVQQWASTWDYLGFDDAATKGATSGSNLNLTGAVTTATPNVYKVATLSLSQSTGSLLATSVGTAVTTTSVDVVTDFTSDGSGNIVIVGSNNVVGQGTNFYVQKVSNTLVSTWTYTWNGSSSLNDVAKAVELDASGNVYIAGFSTSSTLDKELTLIKLNSSGVHQWTQTSGFAGDDEAADLIIDRNNDIYVSGYKTNSSTRRDYYTAKYNSSGTKQWEKEMDSRHQNDNATNMTLDSLDNVIVTGQTEVAPGDYEFTTVKYIQRDIEPFTDLNSEAVNPKVLYLPNAGQLLNTSLSNETDILYYNLDNYPQSYIARNRLSFLQFHRDTLVSTTDSLERIDLVFNGCLTADRVYAEDKESDDDYNFFVGDIKATNVHAHNKIIATEIYHGIDLHYSSNAYGIKGYFVLKAGADPSQINILLQGQQSTTITSNNLQIDGLLGTMLLRKPNVYNVNGGTNTAATGTVGWALTGSTVSINTGSYNPSQPLVIEFSFTNANAVAGLSPTGPGDNLDWCTYYGNTANDGFTRIAIDKANNKYAGGTSDGNNYPTTPGVFSGNNVGGTAIVITKFTHLNERLYSTYFGGTTNAVGASANNALNGIAVDSLQNVFFVGRTNTNNFPFPLTQPSGSYHFTTNSANSGAGYQTSFVSKLDSALQNTTWGTYVGSSAIAEMYDVMVDKNQNVTVGGWSNINGSFSFPAAPTGSYYSAFGLGLLMRFNNSGVVQYGTRTSNRVIRVAENKVNGDYFVSTWLTTGDGSQKFVNPGGVAYYDSTVYNHDLYLARFNNQDSITWATVFGGPNHEYIYDMAVQDSTLILLGSVNAGGFPIRYAPGQYVDSVHSTSGQTDYDVAFVRFNSYTGKWIYSSYYGGQIPNPSGGVVRNEYPTAVVIDNNGNYFISGSTSSDATSGFNLMQASGFYYSGTYYGNNCGFLLSYTYNNDLRLSTYFGGRPYQGTQGYGSDNTYMYDMGIANGALFVAGQTNANRYFPIYDASGGVAYFDSVLTSPLTTQAYTDGFMASFTNLAFVGVKNIDKNEVYGDVLVYPNPSSGIYNVEVKGVLSNKNVIFNVYNTLGQIVHMQEGKSRDGFISQQINLSGFTEGVYFITITQDNKTLTAKVIKQ